MEIPEFPLPTLPSSTRTSLTRSSQIRIHTSLIVRVLRCSTLLVNNLPIILNVKLDLHMCFTQTWVIHLALLTEQHSPQQITVISFIILLSVPSCSAQCPPLSALVVSLDRCCLVHHPPSCPALWNHVHVVFSPSLGRWMYFIDFSLLLDSWRPYHLNHLRHQNLFCPRERDVKKAMRDCTGHSVEDMGDKYFV